MIVRARAARVLPEARDQHQLLLRCPAEDLALYWVITRIGAALETISIWGRAASAREATARKPTSRGLGGSRRGRRWASARRPTPWPDRPERSRSRLRSKAAAGSVD